MAKIYSLPDKPIFSTYLYRAAYGYQDANGKVISKDNVLTSFDWNGTIFLKTHSEVKTAVDALIKPLNSKETLFFDDTSSFPRFKLQGSPFKRCIKLEKATKTVISDSIMELLKTGIENEKHNSAFKVTVVENPNFYLWLTKNDYYEERLLKNLGKKGETLIDLFKRYGILGKDDKVIYEGPVVQTTTKTGQCIENILNQVYDEITFDSTLDKTISGTMESFDSESLDSIMEMLSSEDKAIVDMGLKLIPNYNVMEYKLSINTILSLNHKKCVSSKVWQSTALKQLKETIKYEDPYTETFPGCIEKINRKENYTEKDVNYAKELIVGATRTRLSSIIEGLADSVKTYNIKINADVQ